MRGQKSREATRGMGGNGCGGSVAKPFDPARTKPPATQAKLRYPLKSPCKLFKWYYFGNEFVGLLISHY